MNPAIEDKLTVILPILQGLLASGHYTNPSDGLDGVKLERIDNGADWKAEGYTRRRSSFAIDHAMRLASELIEQLELDRANELKEWKEGTA